MQALVAVAVLCVLAAVAAAMVVGSTLETVRDVVRAAIIGAGTLSLGLFIIPATVIDATSPSCTTLDCDLGPSLGAAAFFVLASLVLFGIVGAGYRLRVRNPTP
jgi:hypothetical protein